jgi:hypothetical protein
MNTLTQFKYGHIVRSIELNSNGIVVNISNLEDAVWIQLIDENGLILQQNYQYAINCRNIRKWLLKT